MRALLLVAAAAAPVGTPAAGLAQNACGDAQNCCSVFSLPGDAFLGPDCYNACDEQGCYRTWIVPSGPGLPPGGRLFGLYIPTLADPAAAPMPAAIFFSDGGDTCRPPAGRADADRYGIVRACAGMGRTRGDGGWEFGNDAVMNAANPLPCGADTSREITYVGAILDTLAAQPEVDESSVWTSGFSLNSMMAGYTAFCFQSKIRGAWQAGSGLKITGELPLIPNREGDCRRSVFDDLGPGCANTEPCLDCQSFPVVPSLQPGVSAGLRDCLMIYQGDSGFIHTSRAMYQALAAKPTAEGWQPVYLEFPDGGHTPPSRQGDWIVGCLGIVPHCAETCARWFVDVCMADAGDNRAQSFGVCLNEAHWRVGAPFGCAAGCAPTIEMLVQIEFPTVTTPSAIGH